MTVHICRYNAVHNPLKQPLQKRKIKLIQMLKTVHHLHITGVN